MASTFYELDCGEEEPVLLERLDSGKLVFHGWDRDTELAAIELGFKPSDCFIVWEAYHKKHRNQELRFAAAEGDLHRVELMLMAGANVQTQQNYPLHFAADEGHAAVVELLLRAGADVNSEDGAALRWAAQSGHPAVVKILLQAGADVHTADDEGPDAALRGAQQNLQALEEKDGHFGTADHAAVVAILEEWIEEHG